MAIENETSVVEIETAQDQNNTRSASQIRGSVIVEAASEDDASSNDTKSNSGQQTPNERSNSANANILNRSSGNTTRTTIEENKLPNFGNTPQSLLVPIKEEDADNDSELFSMKGEDLDLSMRQMTATRKTW